MMTDTDKPDAESFDPVIYRELFFKELEIEFLIHELKDPISVIETGAQTLLKKQERFGPLTERQLKTINRISRNAKKAREMLYGLLEIGRSETGSFTCIQFAPAPAIYKVLADCLELQSPAIADRLRQIRPGNEALDYLGTCGIHFNAAPAVESLQMYQDEIKFCQIAGNLIKNALHYRSEQLELRLDVENETFVLAVSDDGPGIPDQYHATIFRRYSQVKDCSQNTRNGHGLGLAGARIMAQCLGGDIDLTSRKNAGTTFRLALPLRFASTGREKTGVNTDRKRKGEKART